MFKKNKNTVKKVSVSDEQAYAQGLAVFKMPEKYVTTSKSGSVASKTGTPHKSHKGLVVGVCVFLFFAIAGIASYFFIFAEKPQPQPSKKSAEETQPKKTEEPTEESPDEINNQDDSLSDSDNTPEDSSSAENVSEDTAENAVEEAVPVSSEPIKGEDKDSDGLTDIEEGLYATHIRRSDSDNDGFSDAEELRNLYDPSVASLKLEDSQSVRRYVNNQNKFSVLYPTSWKLDVVAANLAKMTDSSGDFISVSVSSLQSGESFKEWYEKNTTNQILFDTLTVIEPNKYYRTFDGFYRYVIVEDKVFTFFYDISKTNTIYYFVTFDMMLKSFSIIDESDV